jgi:hypothetical protein
MGVVLYLRKLFCCNLCLSRSLSLSHTHTHTSNKEQTNINILFKTNIKPHFIMKISCLSFRLFQDVKYTKLKSGDMNRHVETHPKDRHTILIIKRGLITCFKD